jgi:hypothetical protein
MPDTAETLAILERRLRRTQAVLAAVALTAAGAILAAAIRPADPVVPEIRTRRLVVVDDKDVPRVVIGQDPVDGQRRARAAGITVHDKTGAERGGFSTLDDGSVVMALDAPVGVGAPMRDRLGMVVWPDGSSYVMLLDNQTRAVAKLSSDGKGGGGPQVFKWDDASKSVGIKTLTFEGEKVETQKMGE